MIPSICYSLLGQAAGLIAGESDIMASNKLAFANQILSHQ